MPPRKRKPEEITSIREPRLSDTMELAFSRGVGLFNAAEYWDAHEAWEKIWREMGDNPEDDWEIILRGLIQVAAGLHCLAIGKLGGAVQNLKKGKAKLELYRDQFLGVDLGNLASAIESCLHSPQQLVGFQIERLI